MIYVQRVEHSAEWIRALYKSPILLLLLTNFHLNNPMLPECDCISGMKTLHTLHSLPEGPNHINFKVNTTD